MIALLGSVVLLVGILSMYWIKKKQQEEELKFAKNLGASVNSGESDGVKITPDEENPSSKQDTTVSQTDSAPTGTTEGQTTPATAVSTTSAPSADSSSADIILPDVKALRPEAILLAQMTAVVFEVNSFTEDARGSIRDAVKSNCVVELNKCRLKCVEDETKPSFVIDLDLRKVGGIQKLGMSAQLLVVDSLGIPTIVWENDAMLIPVNQKSLKRGISLPGLDRAIAQFFVPLRDKIKTSRTSVNSIKEINRRKKAEADKASKSDGE